MIKTFILTILAFFGIYFGSSMLSGIIEPEPIVAIISGVELNQVQYDVLKTDLKTKIANRDKILPINTDVQKWVEIMNLELKKCVLTNVSINKNNIVDIINQNCL